jgi:hypothetical protein
VNQQSSLPLPLPIRKPTGFRDKGKCGNVLNQRKRRVLSLFRVDFFKNNLSLIKSLAVNCIGLRIKRPILPNFKE